MKFHIVRNDETLEDVMYLYNVSKGELIEQNRHIRVWNRLIPGTKLLIPTITEAIQQEVNDMEPFVEDYYPKLQQEDFNPNEEVDIKDNEEMDIISTEDEPVEETLKPIEEEKPVIVDDEIKSKQAAIKKEVEEKIKKMNLERNNPIPNPYRNYHHYYNPYYYQKWSPR